MKPRQPHPFDLTESHYQRIRQQASFGFPTIPADPALGILEDRPDPLAWAAAFPTHDMPFLVMLASGRAGPLERLPSYRCSEIEAAAAAVIALVWSYARTVGMLAGKPSYEAWETFTFRVETSRHEAGSALRWAEVLCTKSQVSWQGKIPPEWQLLITSWSSGVRWGAIRNHTEFWSKAVLFAKLMCVAPGWRYQLLTLARASAAAGDTFIETVEE